MENERTYFLEMPTLIAILARQRRSGIIQADSVHIPGIRGSVFVSLAIVDGAVQSCHIVQKQQKILEGAQAYSALQGIPALEWQWQPLASPPAHSPTRPHSTTTTGSAANSFRATIAVCYLSAMVRAPLIRSQPCYSYPHRTSPSTFETWSSGDLFYFVSSRDNVGPARK